MDKNSGSVNGQRLVRTDGTRLVGTRDGKTVVLRAGEPVTDEQCLAVHRTAGA